MKEIPQELQKILEKYTQEIRSLYGENLREVILYGSYARGDYREDSDIDIMVLVGLDEDSICSTRKQVYDLSYDFWWDYEVDINPIVKNETHFRNWVESYPFYSNVDKEGVRLYAA